MLIDVSRYPLVLLPDECPSGIVLRSISAGGVCGIVYQESVQETQRQTKSKRELPPTELLHRGTATYLETKLPLREAQEVTPIASVFELASALGSTTFLDPVPAWRVRISILFKPDGGTWHITGWDLARSLPILTIVTKHLNPNAVGLGEVSPLARAKRTIGADMPTNMWTRLLEND